MIFEPGSAVEVAVDNDAFRRLWFSGTILDRVDSDRFLIEYNLSAERAIVSIHHLRPLPPPETNSEFKSGEKVDAFVDNNHWREGHVTENLGNEWFLVLFRGFKEEIMFPKKLLRAHHSWIDGNWVPPIPNRDMISDLPDNILIYVMDNFMDTKEAVKTCVLSKRWKYLCKRLTTLKYFSPLKEEEDDSYGGMYFEFPARENVEGVEGFKKFAHWILTDRDHSCSLLNLTVESWIEPELLDRVIKYALFHNVQQLKLNTQTHSRHLSPNCDSLALVFSCQSLTSLDLRNPSNKPVLPKTLHLPGLKILHLDCVILSAGAENGSVEPFSNCPVLDTLVLGQCSLLNNDAQVLYISNSTLSSLTIDGLEADQTVLSTPNLSSLTIVAASSHHLVSTCNLSFLQEVNIDVRLGIPLHRKNSRVTRWLQTFLSVKRLALTSLTVMMIYHELKTSISTRAQPLSFDRLESLRVDQCSSLLCDKNLNTVLEYLLQRSPMARVDIIRSKVNCFGR